MLPIVKKHLFIRKDIIDKSFFSEVFSLSSLRSLKDRCFRKANTFDGFGYEYKIDNF